MSSEETRTPTTEQSPSCHAIPHLTSTGQVVTGLNIEVLVMTQVYKKLRQNRTISTKLKWMTC